MCRGGRRRSYEAAAGDDRRDVAQSVGEQKLLIGMGVGKNGRGDGVFYRPGEDRDAD